VRIISNSIKNKFRIEQRRGRGLNCWRISWKRHNVVASSLVVGVGALVGSMSL